MRHAQRESKPEPERMMSLANAMNSGFKMLAADTAIVSVVVTGTVANGTEVSFELFRDGTAKQVK